MNYRIRENCIFEHVDVFQTEGELKNYLNSISAPLGLLIIEFNALEDEVTMHLSEVYTMLDLPINLELLQMMYGRKTKELIRRYKQLTVNAPELRSEVNDLKRGFANSAEVRNRFTHASWLYTSPSKGVSCSEDKSVYRKFSASDIQDGLNVITRSRAHLIHLHQRLAKC
ncbi:TPA: hypothetical protein ACMD2S_004434 [Vibrio parahaemolyticus]